jgi:Tfp pilus assembly protein PilE
MAEGFEQGNSLSDEKIEEVKGVVVSSDQSKTEVTEEDFAHFIGKKADKYLPKFRKFSSDGVDKFSVTWHWPVFFFGFFWMLYRKLYLWALFAFAIGIISLQLSDLGLLIAIPWGMTGNYIYYKHAKKKILKLKTDQPSLDLSLMETSLLKIGGVNRWAAYIPIIIPIAGIWMAIIIPNYHAYKMRSYNAAAHSSLRNAAMAQEAYYLAKQAYADSTEKLTGDKYASYLSDGSYLSEGVTIYVQSADRDHYLMVAFHEKGNRKYVITGPGGVIKETDWATAIQERLEELKGEK